MNLPVKEERKSVNIWLSYCREFGVFLFFLDMVDLQYVDSVIFAILYFALFHLFVCLLVQNWQKCNFTMELK